MKNRTLAAAFSLTLGGDLSSETFFDDGSGNLYSSNFIQSGTIDYATGLLAFNFDLEPQFYAELVDGLGLAGHDLPDQNDESQWPALKELFAERFGTKTRDEWLAVFEGRDACVFPVLTMDEAPGDPHLQEWGTYVEENGVRQAAPAPRFSRTDSAIQSPPPHAGQHTDEVLAGIGLSTEEVAGLRESGAVA